MRTEYQKLSISLQFWCFWRFPLFGATISCSLDSWSVNCRPHSCVFVYRINKNVSNSIGVNCCHLSVNIQSVFTGKHRKKRAIALNYYCFHMYKRNILCKQSTCTLHFFRQVMILLQLDWEQGKTRTLKVQQLARPFAAKIERNIVNGRKRVEEKMLFVIRFISLVLCFHLSLKISLCF